LYAIQRPHRIDNLDSSDVISCTHLYLVLSSARKSVYNAENRDIDKYWMAEVYWRRGNWINT